jgi:hypothetical protein
VGLNLSKSQIDKAGASLRDPSHSDVGEDVLRYFLITYDAIHALPSGHVARMRACRWSCSVPIDTRGFAALAGA